MKRLLAIAALWVAALPCFASISHATHYAEITVNATSVDEAVDWFYATGSQLDSTFWENATQGNVRWTNSDGTAEVAFYTISFTDSGSTGTAAWLVKGTYVSASVDATYRIYFGGSASEYAATDTYGRNNVFDTNTKSVYLPGETTTELTGSGLDLTAVNTPGTAASDYEGITAATYVTNKYHYASSGVAAWPASVEALYYTNSTTSDQQFAGLVDSSDSGPNLSVGQTSGGKHASYARGDGGGAAAQATSSASSATSTYYHRVGTRDGESGTTRTYIDGSQDGTNATSINAVTFNRFAIGAWARSSPIWHANGGVALAVVHNVERSANYISTRYNNFSAPDTFLTHGSSNTISGGPSGHPWFYMRRN